MQVAHALDGKCRVLKMDSDDEADMAATLNVSPSTVVNWVAYIYICCVACTSCIPAMVVVLCGCKYVAALLLLQSLRCVQARDILVFMCSVVSFDVQSY